MNELTTIEDVKNRMLTIRDQHVLLDRDVAALYGVETRIVNQAVKRNPERFFDGYILELTPEECSRSQIVTLNGKRGSNLKYLPHAFTERGLYMLATILKSPRAIQATHAIIETYAQVRELKRELAALLAPSTGFAPETIVVLSAAHVGPSINDLLASHPHVELQLPDELKNLLSAPLYVFSIPPTLNSLHAHSQSCLTLATILLALKSGHITIPNS